MLISLVVEEVIDSGASKNNSSSLRDEDDDAEGGDGARLEGCLICGLILGTPGTWSRLTTCSCSIDVLGQPPGMEEIIAVAIIKNFEYSKTITTMNCVVENT